MSGRAPDAKAGVRPKEDVNAVIRTKVGPNGTVKLAPIVDYFVNNDLRAVVAFVVTAKGMFNEKALEAVDKFFVKVLVKRSKVKSKAVAPLLNKLNLCKLASRVKSSKESQLNVSFSTVPQGGRFRAIQ